MVHLSFTLTTTELQTFHRFITRLYSSDLSKDNYYIKQTNIELVSLLNNLKTIISLFPSSVSKWRPLKNLKTRLNRSININYLIKKQNGGQRVKKPFRYICLQEPCFDILTYIPTTLLVYAQYRNTLYMLYKISQIFCPTQ